MVVLIEPGDWILNNAGTKREPTVTKNRIIWNKTDTNLTRFL